jgi:hypothetical protein
MPRVRAEVPRDVDRRFCAIRADMRQRRASMRHVILRRCRDADLPP